MPSKTHLEMILDLLATKMPNILHIIPFDTERQWQILYGNGFIEIKERN